MLKNIFRSLIRYKTSTALNLIGLSVAFAAFIVIMMQVNYYVSYDKSYKDYKRIYILSPTDSLGSIYEYGHYFNRQLPVEIQEAIPEIENMTFLGNSGNVDGIESESTGEYVSCSYPTAITIPSVLDIFSFEIINGDPNCLNQFNQMVIPESTVKKYFPNSDPIGKKIKHRGADNYIGAVYKDFPKNSSIKNVFYVNIGDENINAPNNENYVVYIKLREDVSKADVDAKLAPIYIEKKFGGRKTGSDMINISDYTYVKEKTSRSFTAILMSIAILLLIIASINFINFATSLTPLKIKGVNLRKVVGARVSEIRRSMIMETVVLAFISFIVALGLVYLFKVSSLSDIMYADMSFENNIGIYGVAFLVAILTGFLSGIYPAVYTTSFQPALVLKSSFALTASGEKLRFVLIGFQFFISMSLLIVVLFSQAQFNHMMSADGGYTKEGIVHVNHGFQFGKTTLLKEKLLMNPNIKDVAFSYSPFGTEQRGMGWGRSYSKGSFTIASYPVSTNFLDFFDIKMVSGRRPIPSDDLSESGAFIMNKKAMDTYEFSETELLHGHKEGASIIGVCENINYQDMKHNIEPMAFYIFGKYPWADFASAYVKIDGNIGEALEYIKKTYREIDPAMTDFTVNFLDEEFRRTYNEEVRFKTSMTLFSMLAIIIALVGVFGLVSFDTHYRRKEIGIRKINGATVNEILAMFSFTYLKIVIVSFVLAAPVSYYFVSKWLESFPYKIAITPWIFLISLAAVLLLTLAITVAQSYRSATENPATAIKKN